MSTDAPLEDGVLAAICKALAHPARLKILRRLLKEDRCICGQIVEDLPLAQSTISQHLKVMRTSGLIRGEVDGPRTCYCVDRRMWERFKARLAAL